MADATARPTLSLPEMHGFTVAFDAEEAGWAILCPGDTLEANGAYDWADTRAGAVKLAKRYGREHRAEALRDELGELMAECNDPARLERALAALKGA